MTVSLDIPSEMLERVEHFAEVRETNVHALLLEAVAEYLEELEDIADAQAQRRRLQRGETRLIPMEEVHARLMAQDDMSDAEE